MIGAAAGGGGEEDAPSGGAGDAAANKPRSSLRRDVGELLVMSFDGAQPPDYILRRLRRGEGSGVILFGSNATSAPQLRRLTRRLQRAAHGGALIATDQEGGDIRSVAFAGPEAGQAARPGGSPAAAAAHRLRGLGVNVNLAPVADVARPASVMAGRAYGGGARDVGRDVAADVSAHDGAGVAAAAKHFPGLGAARENTDDAPVTVGLGARELRSVDLVPFGAAVDAGVPLVMASHALYPTLDRGRIASQSRAILQGELRRRLRFRGVVVTDSMEADAVLRSAPLAVAAERSVAAGCDLLLLTGSGSWKLVYPRLLRAARRSPALRARVREAASRVRALKRRLGLRAPG